MQTMMQYNIIIVEEYQVVTSKRKLKRRSYLFSLQCHVWWTLNMLLIQFTVTFMLNSNYVLDQFTMSSMLNPKKEFCWTWINVELWKKEFLISGSGEASAVWIWTLLFMHLWHNICDVYAAINWMGVYVVQPAVAGCVCAFLGHFVQVFSFWVANVSPGYWFISVPAKFWHS